MNLISNFQNFIVILLINTVFSQLFFSGNIPNWNKKKIGSRSTGRKLLLTEYIDGGDDLKARQLARVDKSLFLNVTSYSGYLTVDKEYNSNLFFWFFPAEGTEHLYDNNDFAEYDYENLEDNKKQNAKNRSTPDWEHEDRPLVLWLQGGPGASSLFGLFTENGPFFINEDQISIKKNPFSWHKNYSMLYIDNPVGAGFSFTENEEKGYTTNVTQVAKHMHIALTQFLKMFPWLQRVSLFIAGESYAGKYLPAIGYEIFEQNKFDDGKEFKINLKGLAIGNGFVDPYNMLSYSTFAVQVGLVDYHTRNEMKVYEILAQENIKKSEAKVFWDLSLYTFIKNSRYANIYNILQPGLVDLDTYVNFVDQTHIRKALHIGNQEFAPPTRVYYNLLDDFMDSAMPWVESLLDRGLRIMFYSGNLDFIVAYPLSQNAFYNMHWSGADEYKQAKRLAFVVNKSLAGYIKRAKKVFYEAVVLNAGHMVPTDQPQVALELIDDFIYERF